MKIKIDNTKAISISKDKIRAWREEEFKKNDVVLQNAIADDNTTLKNEAITRRDELRDMPDQCEGKSIEELKQILDSLV